MDTGNTKHRLLLVDGDPKSLRVLGVSLRKAGFAVVTATSGREALAALEAELPSLIISDTDLDEIDGFELCRQIKAKPEWAKIPFLFVSGRKSIEDKIRGLELGVDDYLTKPIYIKEIGIRVRTALQRVQRERLESRRDGRTKFAGDLSDIGVVDLVQTIDVNRKSGIVHIVNRDGRRGAVFFRDGNVIDAEVGHLAGVDAMYRLFSWAEGRFEVEFKPIRRKDVIDMPSAGLLMEGMRRLDEWTRLLESLPPLDAVPEVDVPTLAEQLGDLPDEMNGILRLCDGKRSLLAVVDDAEIPDLDALTLVSRLFAEKILVARHAEASDAEDPAVIAWLGEGDSAPNGTANLDALEAAPAPEQPEAKTPPGRTLPPPAPWLTSEPSQPQEGPTPRVTLRGGVPLTTAEVARSERDTPQVLPVAKPNDASAGAPNDAHQSAPATSDTLPGFAVNPDPPLAEAPWPFARDSAEPDDSGTGVPTLVPPPEERITSEYGSRARSSSDASPGVGPNDGDPTGQERNEPEAPQPNDSPSPRAPAASAAEHSPSASSESPDWANGTTDDFASDSSGSHVLVRRLGLGTVALGLVALAALAPRWVGSHKDPAPVVQNVDARIASAPVLPVAAELAPPADASVPVDAKSPETISPRETCLKVDEGGKGRPKAVLAVCRPAVKTNPRSADLLIIMARAELDRGKAEESRDWAKRAIEVDPSLPDAYIYLGTAEQELGNKGEAKAAYQKYLQLVPTGRRARELRAVLDNL